MASRYRSEVVEDIGRIEPGDWNALCPDSQPFIRHEFLHALERHGCVGHAEGWRPRHLTLRSGDDELVAAMPLYLKDHSWGEYVFDFAWAQAYARHGLEYYPKLVGMCPFTPVSGSRLLCRPDYPGAAATLAGEARSLAEEYGVSSLHVLYPREAEVVLLERAELLPRRDIRFMWTNDGFDRFDDFLAGFSAANRKKIRRERRRVAEQQIEVETVAGDRLTTDEWRIVYDLCATTFLRRGNAPYLTTSFFLDLRHAMSDNLLVNVARRDGLIVGAAILFRDDKTLYGRYWGGLPGIDCLHFETCYYRGIEYCIEQGLDTFDPGTQGEHKLRRGFTPATTWSAHWIAEPAFRRAIAGYLDTEREHVKRYRDELRQRLPFRKEP